MLYGDWIGRWGRSFPQAEALVDVSTNRRYTYGELRDDVHRMANFLRADLQIGKGDRVAVLSLTGQSTSPSSLQPAASEQFWFRSTFGWQ